MLPAKSFVKFIALQKEKLAQVEEQYESITRNIKYNWKTLWLDPILTRVFLAGALSNLSSIDFRVPMETDTYKASVDDYLPIIQMTERTMQEVAPILGITKSDAFPSTLEQAEILELAFKSKGELLTMFQEKGYKVEMKLLGLHHNTYMRVFLDQYM